MNNSFKKYTSIKEFLTAFELLPENNPLIKEALTHSSLKHNVNYEKLEFFGDAVLRLAASEFIRNHFPKLNVGQQSALRAQLVSDLWLSDFAHVMNIEELILVSPEVMRDRGAISTIRAEIMEAIIGAIYLKTQSTNQIIELFNQSWYTTSTLFLRNPSKFNSKSTLQEWSQTHQLGLPAYITSEQSQKHGDERRFKSQVTIADKVLIRGEGWGHSRKEAEQNAAREALDQLDELDSGNNVPQ